MSESDRIKKLQSKVIYAAYLIEKDATSNGSIGNLHITSGDLAESISVGPTSFTPVELNSVLVNNDVIIPELIVASGITVPSPPQNLSGLAGNTRVILTWSPPESNGGLSITKYYVNVYNSGNTLFATIDSGLSLTDVIRNLTNGVAYNFTVFASNLYGPSLPSLPISVIPTTGVLTVPGAPTGVTGVSGNGQVVVSWSAPINTGGSAITSYRVTYTPGGVFTDVSGEATTATITGLTNGQAYIFRVVATNFVGPSVSSVASSSLTPASVPGAPTGVTAVAGNGQAAVSWSPPSNTGGSAITSYTVTSSPGGFNATTTGGETSAIVTGLTNGQAYTFTVVAINTVGSSVPSGASASVTPVTVPSAATGVIAVAGNQQAAVSWTEPNNGGSAIIRYTVTSSPGGFTASIIDGQTTATVTGLTNGTAYTFTVISINAIGPSAPSVSNSVRPTSGTTAPSAPSNVRAETANQEVLVSWSPPSSTGGSPITSYTVTSSPGGFTATTSAGETSARLTGLTNGQAYTFTVVATNAVGSSVPSAASAPITPASVPDAPTGVTGVSGNQQVALSWTAPNNGGSPITGYRVTSSPGGLFTDASGGETTGTVTGLTNGTAYTFTVVATNAVGPSASSGASASVTPATVPSAPTNVTGVSGNQQVAVSWTAPNNGGSPITGYRVTSSPGGLIVDVSGNQTTGTLTGLTNGTAYTFTVVATNAVGSSTPSGASASVIPATVPGAPTLVTAIRGNQQVAVSWTAPNNGGSPITGYRVTSSPGGFTATASASSLTATVIGLTNGQAYTFTVVAINAVGSSVPSEASASVTPATVPDAPTNVTGIRGDQQVAVSWSEPNTGGSAIIFYRVTSSPGGLTATTSGGETSATVSGLTNGQAYTFTVVATNAVGSSVPSVASTSVTPATVPSAPTGVTGIRGNQQVAVSWTAPNNGGSAITGYRVTSSPGGFFVDVSGNQTTGTVTGLTNGQAYTFTVVATNAVGSSVPSGASASVIPATVPGAPTGLTGVSGNQQVALSWTAPANGGSPITGYRVTSSPGGFFVDVSGNQTTGTVNSLTNGTAYTFTVVATNTVGSSTPSEASASVTPATVPSAPTGVTGVSGNQQVAVSWTAPDNGGSPITGYRVTSSPGGLFTDASGGETSATVTGLTNGTAYTFTVVATNAVGSSVPSAASASVIPATVPDAPTGVTGVSGNQQVAVSWTEPANGGSPITGYRVTSSPGGFFVDVSGNQTTGTVNSLTNGTAYTFTVVATNAVGSSTPSEASPSVTPTTVPGAPTGVTGVSGNQQVTVSWTPSNNGGSSITSYRVTSSPGGLFTDASGGETSATVTGLTNGTAYTFTVVATNAIGSSVPSVASASVIPATVPDAPTGVTGVSGNQQVAVSWTAPNNGGSPITGYRVTSSPGGLFTDASGLSAIVTGLTNGTAYTFTVVATNAVGSSVPSAASASVIPATVPDAPTGVTGVSGNQQVAVSWTAPNNGGSAIIFYRVTSSPGGFTATTSGGETSATVTGLTNGTAYTFTVVATNAVGSSVPSVASASVTPATIPSAPTGVTGIRGNQQVAVSWTAPNNGGSPITGYRVTSSPGGLFTDSSGLSAIVTGLTNGTAYTFTVIATNAVGPSVPSEASASVIPATVPDAPTGVTGVSGNQQVAVSWTAPNNGGTPITGYRVTSTPGGLFTDASGGETSAIVTGLTNGTAYTFTVVATNAVGPSAPSGASASVTPATVPGPPTDVSGATVPGAPTGVTGVSGNQQVAVSWTAPNNGGSPITGYTVTSSPGGLIIDTSGNVTTGTVTGLTNGTAYTFTVVATNAVGPSVPSVASSSVTPTSGTTVPGAPTNVTGVRGNQQVAVSWTAPNTGGSAITGYTVTSNPGGLFVNTSGNVTTGTVTGLTNGTSYTFTVVARNAVGSSVPSGDSAPVTPATVPGAPTGVTGVPANQQVAVSWSAPASTGGSAITGYTVTSSPGGFTATSVGTTATVTGLTNGTAYTFTVVATNAFGPSLISDASEPSTPATAPGAPTGVTAVKGNTSALISWTAPISDGGSAITSYTVTSSPGGVSVTTYGQTSTTVSGLTNGLSYTFRVIATNSVGDSEPSAASAAVTPVAVPDPPTNCNVVGGIYGSGVLRVNWTPPVNTGDSAIISYTVVSDPDGITASTNGETTTVDVSGLTAGVTYTFTVYATNTQGNSIPSDPSARGVPYSVPSQPTAVTALKGNTTAFVSWTSPVTNGGLPISGFTVTSNPGSLTATTDGATSATVTGLTNGQAYTFTVVATNALGDSVPSGASNSVTPATVPDSPTDVTAVGGARLATVSWVPPVNTVGSAITSYTVTSNPDGRTATTNGATTTDVLNLTPGQTYSFTVYGTNTEGNSFPSEPSPQITLSDVTVPPTDVTGVPGDTEVTVSWSPPSLEAYTLPPIFYRVTSNPGGFTATTAGAETTATITGLTNATSYTFTVISTNALGDSEASQPSASIIPLAPGDPPGAPINVTAIPTDGQVIVSWDAGSTGTSPLIRYTVTPSEGTPVILNSTQGRTVTFTGLINNTTYTYVVVATNSSGNSPSTTIYATPGFVPGIPQGVLLALIGYNQVVISWDYSPDIITFYRVNVYDSSNNPLTEFDIDVDGSQTYINIGGLTVATLYKFTVTARNNTGQGQPSSPASITVYNSPSNITDVSGILGDGQVTISWSPPPDNGGKAIVSYRVFVYDENDNILSDKTKDLSANILTTIITGLTNGILYKFNVSSSNGALTNNLYLSIPISVTPGAPPSTPTPSISASGYDFIDIGWTAPYNGGYTITSYTVHVYNSSDVEIPSLNKTVTTLSTTIDGLTNGTTYKLTVAATNAIGTSVESSKLTATTISAPSAPSVPRSVTTTPGLDEVTVDWLAPTSNGGSALTAYRVTVYDASNAQLSFVDVSDNILTKTITSLTAGLVYRFTVSAINAVGTTTSQKVSGIPQNVPGAVVDLSGSFPTQIGTLRWTPPSNNGGLPITSYTVNGDDVGLPTEPIISGIYANNGNINGVGSYTYTVRAVNAIGPGPPSTITVSYVTVPATPDMKPTNAPVEVGNTQIRVTWPTPYTDGGSPITSYTIKLYSKDGEILTLLEQYSVAGTERTKLITGLTNGTTYVIGIIATNIVGTSTQDFFENGTFGSTARDLIPIAVPFPPTNVTRTLSANGITVSWIAPTNEGGSAITDYTVRIIPSTGEQTLESSTSTSKEITGLPRGVTYTFNVSAVNTQGNSIYSLPTQPLLYPPTKPGVVNDLNAQYDEANTEIDVTWSVPDNGGSEITGYTVSSNRGDLITTDGNTLFASFTPVTPGLSYTFTIISTNAIGSSDPSAATVAVYPGTRPGAPTNVTGVAGDSQATISWTAPDAGTLPITNYTVTSSPDGITATTLDGSTTTVTVIGLTNDQSYIFTVIARSPVGNSVDSDATESITPTA